MHFYDRWLAEHPNTNVVRLTTLAYHFNLDVNVDGSDKFRDWTGCQETVSLKALEDFEAEYGYRPRAEDFVDEGYYNAVSRVPSKRYLDWMAFVHRFVVRFAKALIDRAHAAGRTTAMFWGETIGQPWSRTATSFRKRDSTFMSERARAALLFAAWPTPPAVRSRNCVFTHTFFLTFSAKAATPWVSPSQTGSKSAVRSCGRASTASATEGT